MERLLLENVIEIAVLFGRMAEAGELDLEKEDSATERLYDNLEHWSEEFEAVSSENEDYYEAIEAFGKQKFRELGWYSPKSADIQETTKERSFSDGFRKSVGNVGQENSRWKKCSERSLIAELEGINQKLSVIANFFQ